MKKYVLILMLITQPAFAQAIVVGSGSITVTGEIICGSEQPFSLPKGGTVKLDGKVMTEAEANAYVLSEAYIKEHCQDDSDQNSPEGKQ